jgi:hypothetical protein
MCLHPDHQHSLNQELSKPEKRTSGLRCGLLR